MTTLISCCCTLAGRTPSPEGGTAAQSQYGHLKVDSLERRSISSSPSETDELSGFLLPLSTDPSARRRRTLRPLSWHLDKRSPIWIGVSIICNTVKQSRSHLKQRYISSMPWWKEIGTMCTVPSRAALNFLDTVPGYERSTMNAFADELTLLRAPRVCVRRCLTYCATLKTPVKRPEERAGSRSYQRRSNRN
jgi:hypothetical protein